MRDRIAVRIDALGAPSTIERRGDVLGAIVEEDDVPSASAAQRFEALVNRPLGLREAKQVRRPRMLKASDRGEFGRAVERATPVPVHEA